MTEKLRLFRSPEFEAQFDRAYQSALSLWPVPQEESDISTRFGETHVIASGSKNAAPLVLFHPAGCGAPIWCRNAGPFSRRYRTYAVDVMGEANKSIPTGTGSKRLLRRAYEQALIFLLSFFAGGFL
jgi:hypothetical protein